MQPASPTRWPAARRLAVVAVAVALVGGGVVLAQLWRRPLPDELGFVATAVLAGLAWIGMRFAPRTTLIVVAALVALPLWRFPVVGVRIVPLVLAGLLAALQGLRAVYVVPVYAAGIVLALVSDTTSLMWRFRDWGVAVVAFYDDNLQKLLIGVVAAAVLAVGFLIRRQQVSGRALQARTLELAALRREEDARIVADTRTAIARDIHDVVAHHMSAVVVMAQSAAADPRRDPQALHDTVVTIAAEGQEALAAMRSAVRMLRNDTPDGMSERTTDITPVVEAMAERVRATGREVTVEGAPSSAPQFAQVALAHIVQEALTNVMLHSDAQAVVVSFAAAADELTLHVSDDGSTRAGATPGGGNGVIGMAERARALGGTLTAGPRSDGDGWTVAAVLPVRGAVRT